MASTNFVDPLAHDVQIVDENGLPTPEFLRQLQVQREANGELGPVVDDVAALKARNINTGTGLSGGGDLSADRTLVLDDTAVTAGTYGDATNTPQVTVDAQGRLTAVADVPITGGGGGGSLFAWPAELDTVVSVLAAPWKGNMLTPMQAITLSKVHGYMNIVSGASYVAAAYRLDGSNNIDELTAVSATVIAGASATPGVLTIDLAASLVANSRYAVVIGRTDSTTTHVLPMTSEPLANSEALYYPTMPLVPYVESAVTAGASTRINNTVAPVIGTAVAVTPSTIAHGIGLTYAI